MPPAPPPARSRRATFDERPLRAPGTVVVTLLATALAELARRMRAVGGARGLDLVIRAEANAMVVELTAPDHAIARFADAASLLENLITDEPSIAVAGLAQGVAVRLAT